MIVYGTRSTLLKSEIIFDQCPNCNTSNKVQMNVFQRYAHLFWIPFLPAGKYAVSQCTNCGQVLKEKQMPATFKLSYDNLKSQVSTPIWNFVGIFLISLLIGGLFIADKQKAGKVSKMLLSPKKDDVFQIKLKDDIYTLYKVKKVEGDTVYFFANKFQTDQESGLSDLATKEYETSETYGVPIKKLVEMDKDSKIIDIERN